MSELDGLRADKDYIPSYASVKESGYYTLNAIEEDYGNMMKDIGLQELNAYETTGEPVKEGAVDLVAKIVQFFKDAWIKIKGLFEKFLHAIAHMIDNMKQKGKQKNKTEFAASLKAVKAKGTDNLSFGTTKDWTHLEAFCKEGLKSYPAWNDIEALKYDAAKKSANTVEKVKSTVASKVGASDSSNGAIRKAADRYFCGGDKGDVKIDIKYIDDKDHKVFETTYSELESREKIKKFYTDSKTTIDGLIDDAKKSKDAISKATIETYKFTLSALSMIDSAALSALKQRCSDYNRAIFKVNMEASKLKVKGEAAIYEPSSYQTEVASLFDWDI